MTVAFGRRCLPRIFYWMRGYVVKLHGSGWLHGSGCYDALQVRMREGRLKSYMIIAGQSNPYDVFMLETILSVMRPRAWRIAFGSHKIGDSGVSLTGQS